MMMTTQQSTNIKVNSLLLNSVYRIDPTKTLYLRKAFASDMYKRFRALRGAIRIGIVGEDCFNLNGIKVFVKPSPPGFKAFDFPRSSDKVSAFMEWLKTQEEAEILEVFESYQFGEAIEEAWTNKYIQSAYQRGLARAREELIKAKYKIPGIDKTGGIETAFYQPFHLDRVGLLYTRVFNDLKGITDAMDQQISRVLSQAMAEGRNPRQIAKLLTKTITGPDGDLGITDTLGRHIPAQRRALLLTRSEIIRAHHQAMIQEYKNWGLEGIKIMAELKTSGDGTVCKECSGLEGEVYTLKEAENLIPVHPQCRCVALPLDITDTDKV